MTSNGTALITTLDRDLADVMEQVIIKGDLEALTAKQRVDYYNGLCRHLGLNPLTRPFEYLKLSGKLTLYPNKNAAEQIRRQAGVSISGVETEHLGDLYVVTARARIGDREDSDIGAVNIAGKRGDDLANALKKAVTQAKRRVTFSLCGLGMLDETEIEDIPGAQRVTVDDAGNIRDVRPVRAELAAPPADAAKALFGRVVKQRNLTSKRQIQQALGLPDEEGSLDAAADLWGWDKLRKCLEDGITLDSLIDTGNDDADPAQAPLMDVAAEQERVHGDPVDAPRGRRA